MSDKSADPKKIFMPETPDQLLLGWLLHSHKGRQRHDWAARRLERQRTVLGTLATILSAGVGASAFSALQQTSPSWLKIALAFISMIAAGCVSLTTFLNLAERAEKHRTAAVRYKETIRELERRFSEASKATVQPDVNDLEKQINELEINTPIVPEAIYKLVDDEWEKRGAKIIKDALDFYIPPNTEPEQPRSFRQRLVALIRP